jgi:hypothetical protein
MANISRAITIAAKLIFNFMSVTPRIKVAY